MFLRDETMRTTLHSDKVAELTVRSYSPPVVATQWRLLQVINQLGVGGTELGLRNVVSGLGSDFEHRVCAMQGLGDAIPLPRGTPELVLDSNSGRRKEFALWRLAAIMRQYRPHIVHSRNWGAIEAVAAARLAAVPVVIHSEHGYEVEMLAGLPLRRRVLRRALYGMADAVVTVTKELRDYHAGQAWFSSKRIRVIYNGVDTNRFSPCLHFRKLVRDRLGIPPDSFLVGGVGRLVRIKDYLTLLKAARVALQRGKNLSLVLAGSGPELSGLVDFVRQTPELAGRTNFIGVSANVPELLNALDVLVLPSLKEGMSNTLLEGMATGLPLLATAVGGNPEIIEDTKNGFLFSPGDSHALADQLCTLADSPELCRLMGEAGRRRALGHFSLDHMLQQYRDLYVGLAIQHRADKRR